VESQLLVLLGVCRYALGVGHGMIDYTCKIRIPSLLCDPGEELDRLDWGKGRSIDVAIQVAA
jgi:hypothetical protein